MGSTTKPLDYASLVTSRHRRWWFHVWLLPLLWLPGAIGSIPFGLLVGLAKGIDVRKGGSGNIGATNVGRQLGKKFFFIVFFLDMLKSLIPMAIASAVVARIPLEQR
ncbi:MAG TPA: glycerol-3-phosphate acyltransferase, partial [Tepidisphaeraceae bacterium]|nr:glycerol-3-phosphate acyltransferase [Tepidisphaeraceae bacterium]